MLFNTIDFAIFLPIVFLLYWFVVNRDLRLQNILVVAASYLFYGWWDWRFLSLILFSTAVDYMVGNALYHEQNRQKRKVLLWVSIGVNLGLLGFFKYYNFFLSNFITAFSFFGNEIQAGTLEIVLPVGISFYTFQTLSYSIDVYRRKLKPTHDLVSFAAFVSFFPQLVAGPIERATNLLPQFYRRRTFDHTKAVDGLRQMLWGVFKKIVIADTAAPVVNEIFANSAGHSGSTLVVGAVLFSIQIYADFPGYSDIAIGTARLFGFNLRQNFAFPFFSRDIGELWRRWHISLSTWLRDYLYIPLGGNRGGTWLTVRNTLAIFILSGLWHGANWTFIIWGALNALYFLPRILRQNHRIYLDVVAQDSSLPTFKELRSMLWTFSTLTLGFIFFRAESLGHSIELIGGIFSRSLLSLPHFPDMEKALIALAAIVPLTLIEWNGRREQHALARIGLGWHPVLRWSFYFIIAMIAMLFSGQKQDFIYFQF